MDIIKLISTLFGIKKSIQSVKHTEKSTQSHMSDYEKEKLKAYQDLEDQQMEEMRIPELEKAVNDSFLAVDCKLSYMENKVWNIAGHISVQKNINKNNIVSLFEKGINICDCMPAHPIKLMKAAQYFYNNYYSPEKQLEYNKHIENIKEKYIALEKELNDKYQK